MARRKAQTSDIVRNHIISGPQLSPDGSQFMFSRTDHDEEKDRFVTTLRICNADGSNLRDFASGSPHGKFRWSPDGTRVAYMKLIDRKMQLMVAPLGGGEPTQVTERGVSDFEWSPDGERMVLVRALPEDSEMTAAEKNAPTVITNRFYKLDGAGLIRKRQHLFALDLSSGKEKQLTRGDWHCTSPVWSPDGRRICFVSNRHRDRWHEFRAHTALYLVPAEGGRAERITPETGASQPAFSPDGQSVAYFGQVVPVTTAEGRQQNLVIADVRGKHQRNVTDRHDFIAGTPFMVDSIRWRADSKKVWFLGVHEGSTHVYECGVARGTISVLSKGDQGIEGFDVHGDRLWLSSGWLDQMQEVRVTLLADWQPKALTKENAALAREISFGRVRRVRYKASDGLPIEGFLVFPPGFKRGKPAPLLMNVHGGPHGYHPMSFNPMITQSKAAAGYVVFLPNPRGSVSYGDDFMRRVVGSWGVEDLDDLLSGVDQLVKQGIADPDKLYLEGYSYGGFMSSWIVGRDHRFKAAVIGAPLTDMTSAWGSGDINTYLGEQIGGTPHDNPETFAGKSPLTYVKNVRTPSMLVHWEGDTRCPLGQSEQFYVALKTLKRKTKFVLYPGGSHGNRTPSQNTDYIERSLAWFSEHR